MNNNGQFKVVITTKASYHKSTVIITKASMFLGSFRSHKCGHNSNKQRSWISVMAELPIIDTIYMAQI